MHMRTGDCGTDAGFLLRGKFRVSESHRMSAEMSRGFGRAALPSALPSGTWEPFGCGSDAKLAWHLDCASCDTSPGLAWSLRKGTRQGRDAVRELDWECCV